MTMTAKKNFFMVLCFNRSAKLRKREDMFDVDRVNVYWLTWVLLRGLHTVDSRSSNPNYDAKIRRSDCALRIKWQVFFTLFVLC